MFDKYDYEINLASEEEVLLFRNLLDKYKKFNIVAGIDEAGRGSLAALVSAGCVILPLNHGIKGINDSKKLSPRKRAYLYDKIIEKAVCYGVGSASNKEIDNLNIQQATHLAASRAVAQCLDKSDIDFIICDGGLDLRGYTTIPSCSIIKGDYYLELIGAASILAKVWRDRKMDEYAKLYPQYGFSNHRGYGTIEHLNAIKKHGLTELHRRTFGVCRSSQIGK